MWLLVRQRATKNCSQGNNERLVSGVQNQHLKTAHIPMKTFLRAGHLADYAATTSRFGIASSFLSTRRERSPGGTQSETCRMPLQLPRNATAFCRRTVRLQTGICSGGDGTMPSFAVLWCPYAFFACSTGPGQPDSSRWHPSRQPSLAPAHLAGRRTGGGRGTHRAVPPTVSTS